MRGLISYNEDDKEKGKEPKNFNLQLKFSLTQPKPLSTPNTISLITTGLPIELIAQEIERLKDKDDIKVEILREDEDEKESVEENEEEDPVSYSLS